MHQVVEGRCRIAAQSPSNEQPRRPARIRTLLRTIGDTASAFDHTKAYATGSCTKPTRPSFRLRGNSELNITYDASGRPQHIVDRDGTWGWTLTTNGATNRVSSITVDGRSDLAWQFAYDASGNLLSITAPDTHVWRAYTYDANDHMTEARDALGNLLEGHTYGVDGRATGSIDPVGEISNAQFAASGRIAGEVLTTVTAATGKSSRYYVRHLAGRPRTVQVDGGCAGCGTGDALYSYDANGHLTRTQDARGYITLQSYDATNGLLIESSGPWQPAGCDPSTASGRCRLTVDTLATSALTATPATTTTRYEYTDSLWLDHPTRVSSDSAGAPGQTRMESMTYDPVTGTILTTTVSGWTGTFPRYETRTTTTALYNGTEAAAFNPCSGTCAFSASWLTLPQPLSLRKSIDGPRSDVVDVTQFVYYPFAASVPSTWRGRLASVRNATGQITSYEDYDVFGNAERVVDSNGVAAESTHDFLGRPLTNTVKGVAGCDTTSDPLCATDIVSTQTYVAGGGPLATITRPATVA